jgi:hypothetical protein
MRSLVSACLLLGLVVLAAPADDKDKKDAKPDNAQQIFQELVKKFREAKKPEDQQELFKTYSKKLVDFAKNAKDKDVGLDALFMVFQIPATTGKNPGREEAVTILNQEHVKNPKLGNKLRRFPASADDAGAMGFLKSVVKENPDKATKAYAARGILKANEQAKQMAEQLKANENLKKQYEKMRGKEAVEKVLAPPRRPTRKSRSIRRS